MLSILEKEKKIIFKFLLILLYLILSNQNLYKTLLIDIGQNIVNLFRIKKSGVKTVFNLSINSNNIVNIFF